MTAPTAKDLRDAIVRYMEGTNPSDARPAFAKALEISGCATEEGLRANPDRWPAVIAELQRLTQEAALAAAPPSATKIINDSIAALPLGCAHENRTVIYRQILGAEQGLEQADVDQMLLAVKQKCPGARIDSIREELDALRSKTHAQANPLPKSSEPVLFRRHETDQIYGGVWDADTGKFAKDWELAPMKPGSPGIRQLYGMFGREPPTDERLPSGTFSFRPGITPQLTKTAAGYEVNSWTPSQYIEAAVQSAVVPPAIRTLLLHVLGGDEAVLDGFLNWFAVVLQTHGRAGTGWVITGVEGTGKGILFEDIIGLLIGLDYCPDLTTRDLEDPFNAWAKTCRVLNVDEARIVGFQAPRTLSILRRLITAATTPVREMHKAIVHCSNYANVILTSNDDQPLDLSPGDRRYNVSPYQKKKLGTVVADIAEFRKQIRAELPHFAGFLLGYEIDKERASEPMGTLQRETMIESSTTTPQRIVRALKEGNLDWFIDVYRTNTEDMHTRSFSRDHELRTGVREALTKWVAGANPAGGKRLSETKISAGQIAVFHNFLLPEKYWRSALSVSEMVGDELPRARANWGRGYRVWWQSKKTLEELALIAHALEHPDADAEKGFGDEPSAPPPQPPPPKPKKTKPGITVEPVVSDDWDTVPEQPAAAPAKANGHANGNGTTHLDPSAALSAEMGTSADGKPFGPKTAAALVGGGIHSAREILDADPEELAKLLKHLQSFKASTVAALRERAAAALARKEA